MQVRRAGLILHLSEHHGDACPGGAVTVLTQGVEELARELNEKKYDYGHPAIQDEPWGRRLTVHDPFGNRIHFTAPKPDSKMLL
jgi:hypothetical protein